MTTLNIRNIYTPHNLKHNICCSLIMALSLLALSSCSRNDKKSGSAPAKEKKVDLPVDTALQNRLKDFAARPRCEGKFGMYVYDLTADKPVYGYNERVAQPTASCMKLLCGVAGLHIMGTGYKYTTSVYTRGQVQGGKLHGDIAFKGSLDPQMTAPDFAVFAKAVKAKGISSLDGHLIVDLVIKDPVKSEAHWYPWDLSFSKYGIFYKGGDRVMKDLKAAFRGVGVALKDSQVVAGKVPQQAQLVYSFSRPMEEVIKRMWKNSSNTQATSLLYTIGHRIKPQASPTAAGVAYLHKFLKRDLSQSDTALTVHDGCGLCIHNRLSPVALTTVLRYGYAHKDIYAVLCRELSISGVDGTLAKYMSGEKTRGKIRAKTGTLSHPFGISSLAGYCQGSNGHTLAFCILDSEMSVLDARVLQRRLCETLISGSEKKKGK